MREAKPNTPSKKKRGPKQRVYVVLQHETKKSRSKILTCTDDRTIAEEVRIGKLVQLVKAYKKRKTVKPSNHFDLAVEFVGASKKKGPGTISISPAVTKALEKAGLPYISVLEFKLPHIGKK